MLSSTKRRMSVLERTIQLRIMAERFQADVLERTTEEVAFDRNRVLNRLDVLSRRAEALGQISTSVRCEELIGRHRGMFVERSDPKFLLLMDPSTWTDAQKEVLAEHMLRRATGGDPERMKYLRHRAEIKAGLVPEDGCETADSL
jgi:hypothetical protein